MKLKFLTLIGLIFLTGFSETSFASCTFEDINEMHFDEEMSRKEIKEECNGETTIPNCTFNKVYRLVKRDMDEGEILDVCTDGVGRGGDTSRICQAATWWCTMNVSGRVGGPCTCVDGRGYSYPGRIISRDRSK